MQGMRFCAAALLVLAAGALGEVRAVADTIEFGPRDDPPPRKIKKATPPAAVPPPGATTAPGAAPPPAAAATPTAPASPPPATTGTVQPTDTGVSPAAGAQVGAPVATPAAATTVPGMVSTKGLPPPPAPANCRNTESFDSWLAGFRKEAAAEGISQRAISSALDGITLDQSVIARDRRQGFFAQSFLDFSGKLATGNRVVSGKAQIAKNKVAFDRAQKEFGVDPAVITGFWALESDFGAGMGKLPIMRSLVTLAYDCRRGPTVFRDELKAALRIIDRGDMTPSTMIGSWAGEIGQTQFLPTRYLEHAIDYDGDGRPNLFSSSTDIIGTTANYMHHLGWRPNEPWLEEVRVPQSLPWDQADLSIKLPRSQWAAWGVTQANGGALPNDGLPASLLLPMGRFGPAFLAYPNFDVYLQWNQSLNYATTAAYLATRIDGAPVMSRGREGIPVLSPEEAKDLQRQLAKRGFDVGEIDGKIGLKTRQAVKVVQQKLGMAADSYPTPELLAALRGGA